MLKKKENKRIEKNFYLSARMTLEGIDLREGRMFTSIIVVILSINEIVRERA